MAFSMKASKKSGREVVLDPILGSVQKGILSYDSSGFEPRRVLGETIVGQIASDGESSCRERCSFFHYSCTFDRNSPSLAVALNWGIGSRSLNALVKALHRLQRVRVENS